MLRTLSATCLAIALADRNGTLRLDERADRWGGTCIVICDETGVIEVALDRAEAEQRIADLRKRVAA